MNQSHFLIMQGAPRETLKFGLAQLNSVLLKENAAGQEGPPQPKRKKTANQIGYREEMCPQMFEDTVQALHEKSWI